MTIRGEKPRFDSSRFSKPRVVDPMARPSPRQKPYHEVSLSMMWATLACVWLAVLWTLSTASLKPPLDGSTSLTVSSRTACPPQTEGYTPLSAAVTSNETFFVVGPLSSPLSPISPTNDPPVQRSGPSTVLVGDGLCLSHFGSRGGLTIVSKFAQYRITHLTIDNSAVDRIIHHPYHPKEGTLWGLIEGDVPFNLTTRSAYTVSDKAAYIMLGSFCFDPLMSVSQTYPMEHAVAVHDQLRFSVFYLEIENNWGGSHTYLCQIKLHGE